MDLSKLKGVAGSRRVDWEGHLSYERLILIGLNVAVIKENSQMNQSASSLLNDMAYTSRCWQQEAPWNPHKMEKTKVNEDIVV